MGRRLGQRPRRRHDREQLCARDQRGRRYAHVGDSRGGTVFARLSAEGQRRRDRREGEAGPQADGRPEARVRAGRLQHGRPRVGRVPHLRSVPDATWVRKAAGREGRRLRRKLRHRRSVAAVRRQRRAPRRPRYQERRRQGRRRRVRWMGRHVFIQRRWRADSARVARYDLVPAGAADRPAPVQLDRRRHFRIAPLRSQAPSGRSRSPATKVSVSSPAGSVYATKC